MAKAEAVQVKGHAPSKGHVARPVRPGPSRPGHAVQGNQALQRLLRLGARPKLEVSRPSDPLELEADRVADQVMRMEMPSPLRQRPPTASRAPAAVQRSCCTSCAGGGPCADEEAVHRSGDGHPELDADGEERIRSLSGGVPLPPAERSFFEARFGADFSDVRVHADAHASQLARSVQARAFTLGSHIAFAGGQYAPETDAGRRLMAHELTHVVQQGGSTATAARRLQRACGSAAIGQPQGCTESTIDLPARPRYLFEVNCDEFRRGSEQDLEADAASIQPGEVVEIHGIASIDGDPQFNRHLSCARAIRAQRVVERVLARRNVAATVSVFFHGALPGDQTLQRSVVLVRPASPTPQPLVPSPVPSNPAPPAPAPPGPTQANCRRARQVECVVRMGGCPNTRPGGVPDDAEISRLNEDCREESGYTGPPVAPTQEECLSGVALPSAEQCRNARLEETHICGPDITQPLIDVLADVRATYAGWTLPQRRQGCERVTDILFPYKGYKMAWDIRELFLPNTGWLCAPPYHGPCGRPPATRCADEDPAGCGNSVQVRDKCFLAGTVNYVLVGQIGQLCNRDFGMLSESVLRAIIFLYKVFDFDDPVPPTAWAIAGFRGFPGNIPTHANRAHCRGRCPVPFTGGPFDWIWEPHKPR